MRSNPMTFLPLLFLVTSIAPSGDAALYDGQTLAQWQTRLGQLEPSQPQDPSVVRTLIAIIADQDLSAEVRRPFAMTLGRMGAASREAIPVLIAQIQQRDSLGKPTYTWAARALGLYGVHARDAVPALVDLLFDERIALAERTLPVEALARIGTAHPNVLPALIRLLQYQPTGNSTMGAAQASRLRELAAEAFSYMGPEADLAAPLLVRAVRNVNETEAVRRKAVYALGAIGSRAALAVPALIETMEFDQSDALRAAASEALGRVGTPALPLLQRYLRHPDPQVRRYVAQSVARMGKQARPALGTLVASLTDSDPAVRLALCESLASLAADSNAYVPQLIALLTAESRQVRMNARRLLVKLGPKTRPFLSQLRQLQNHPEAATRAIVRKTLRDLARQVN